MFIPGIALAVAIHFAPDPHVLVKNAIAAVQGTASLADVHSVRIDGIQHEFLLGNAERAEGPFRVLYTSFSELRDLDNSRMRRTDRGVSSVFSPERVTVITDSVMAIRTGGRETGTSPGTFETMIDRTDASPERALRLAQASAGLKWEGTVRRYGIASDVVSFPWRTGRMRLEISQASHFPVAVEIVRVYPDDFRWAPFGDASVRTEYMNWTLQPSGMWWPMQYEVAFNGYPLRNVTAGRVTFDAAAPADSFMVGDSARIQFKAAAAQSFASFKFGARGPVTEIRPGILRIPDFWTMTMVKQDDGIVIIEAHISDNYLDEVIGEANRRYPGLPIKAIVMTSDPWAHIGGVRQAVARGIPIYVKDASVPFLTALVKSPHTLRPDRLARSPRVPKFMSVSGRTVIGTGANQIVLYPVGGEYGERMLMAHFPQQKLLYGADLIFPNRSPDGKVGPGFSATPASDLRAAITREKLAVDEVFCVQNYAPFDGPAFMANESKPYTK
jgi:hypothetical protein